MVRKTAKMRFVVIIAVLLGLFVCTSAVSGFTATIVQPTGTGIQPGNPVSIKLDNLVDGQLMNLSIMATGLVNTTASGYQVDFFAMPFTLKNGTLIATGNQVTSLQMDVTDESGKSEMFHPAGGGPTITITERRDVTKQRYELIKISGTPILPPNVDTNLWANGTITGSSPTAWLNFTFQGATSGTFSINIFQGGVAAPLASGTYTISVPSGQTVSESKQTPAIAPATVQTVDFTDQTDVKLDITPDAAIPAGTTITVDEYSAPPPAVTTAKPASTYQAIGKYITIEAPTLSGNIGTIRIKVYYTDAEVTGLDVSSLKIWYFNTTAVPAVWEVLNPSGVDTTNRYIWGDTSHFSNYAAFGAPPSSGGGGSGGGGSGGGGGGASGGSTGSFSRPAGPISQVGQRAPSGVSAVTDINGAGQITGTPLTADLTNLPGVAVTWTAQIAVNPPANSKITTAIQQVPDPATLSAFTNAYHLVGKDIGNLAYVMVVQKTGFTSTGPATVTMTAPQDWVTNVGGTDAVSIVRQGDDGMTEVLPATFSGYDPNSGYLIFKADSPNGLCTFGLVGTVPYTAPAQVQPTATAPQGQYAPPQATAATGLPITTIIAGIIVILVVVGTGAYYYTRKDSGKKEEKKK